MSEIETMRMSIHQRRLLVVWIGAWSASTPVHLMGDVERDGFRSIQVNIDVHGQNMLGDAANEPSIVVDPIDRRKMAIGFRQFDDIDDYIRQAGVVYSRDGGHHWTFPGPLMPGEFGSDPVLDVSAEGAFYYASLGLGGLRVFRSLDGGVSWGDPYYERPGFQDKPWVAIDRTDDPGHGHMYLIWGPGVFARSIDGGATFDNAIDAPAPWGVVAVGPDGTVYTGTGRSLNAQFADETPVFDLLGTRAGREVSMIGFGGGLLWQYWIAADQGSAIGQGSVYSLRLTYGGLNEQPIRLVVHRSTDRGETWSNPVDVSDAPSDVTWPDKWFPMLSVAPNGRVDVVWNDQRHDPTGCFSELYHSYSVDAGETWSTNVPLSPSFTHLLGYPSQSPKLGDYYTMVSDNLGVNIAYAATFNGEQDVYFLRVGPWDCNGNDTPDEQDIAAGWSLDINANDIPDDCEVPQDADGNGRVNLLDFAAWQNCHGWIDSRFFGHRPGRGQSGVVALSAGKGDEADADPLCPRFDADANGHADLNDFAVFFEEFTRPQGPVP